MIRQSIKLIALLALGTISINTSAARTNSLPESESRQVDVVIALDVSGSMSGLIESAK